MDTVSPLTQNCICCHFGWVWPIQCQKQIQITNWWWDGLSGSPSWFALLHQAQNILMFSKINFLTKGCGWCGNCGKGKWKLETFSHISVSQGGTVYSRCFTEVTNRKDSEEVVVSVRPSWMWMVMMTIYEIQTLKRWKLRSYIMATYFW